MSTICRDCEAIVVADDDVPADLVRIAMANHERFCKPGRREICDICDDVDFITSSETNIHAVLSRLTGFRSPTPGALAQHLTRHNRHDLTARLPGLHAAIEAQLKGAAPVTADPKKVRAWAAEQGYEVAPSGQIPKAIMADYLDATSGGAA